MALGALNQSLRPVDTYTMQWGDDDERDGFDLRRDLNISMLSLPVRVEVLLSGTPWEFRARLLEAGADYCMLVLVSPCAPAMRRGAAALLHVGTLGGGEVVFAATISDVVPRPTGLTFRCSIERLNRADDEERRSWAV